MRILLVEDDESIAEVLTAVLVEQNYVVDMATDGQTGWELVESVSYDLVLLDVMLPKLDGISFCRQLRKTKNQVLVMLLTARDTTTDKLMGLDSGADDYVVKPFNPKELMARIRALLRRGSAVVSPVLECGHLRLDPSTREVTCKGQMLQFSRKEYLLLELFLRSQNRVFSRAAIVEQIWSLGEDPPNEDTIKSHIKNIRRELKAVGAEDLIETLYGQGYRLNPAFLAVARSPEEPTQTKHQAVDSAVAAIWERTKGVSLERVTFLAQAVRSLKSVPLDADLSQRAVQTAHKLAGSLGTFGFEDASRLARQIEMLLQSTLGQLASSGSDHLPKRISQQLERLAMRLQRELEGLEGGEFNSVSSTAYLAPPLSSVPHPVLDQSPLLLLIDADRQLSEALATEAALWNMRLAIAPDLKTAQSQLDSPMPDAILLNLPIDLETEPEQAQLKAQLTALTQRRTPAIPVLMFSARDRAIDRVVALRAGGELFFPKNIPPAQILGAIADLLQQSQAPSQSTRAKILAVDDDPHMLMFLKQRLEPERIQIIGLEDSTQLWETLRAVQPDLLLLDLNMPEVSGLELCQSVRQDFQWHWLPILFLSAQTDAQTIQAAFAVGADDYIPKPICPEALLTRLFNRLKRSRSLKKQAGTDSLTGLVSQQQSIQALNQLLQLASRSQQLVCLAVLNLDPAQLTNAMSIHEPDNVLQEDKILQQFGQFLKQKFRAGDVVVRWGKEFIVGMYGIHQENGIERLAAILEEWRSNNTEHPSDTSSETFTSLSFSAGIAQYPRDGISLQMLYRTADVALHRAKEAGGDRVLSAEWQPIFPTSNTPKDILLVHPDPEFAEIILRALETRGYHTHWLQNGREAMRFLKGESPNLSAKVALISDSLADVSIIKFLQQLGAKQLRQTRMILLLNQATVAETAQNLGVFDYLLAPFSIPVVIQRLRQALKT